jgi:hypothetical protein
VGRVKRVFGRHGDTFKVVLLSKTNSTLTLQLVWGNLSIYAAPVSKTQKSKTQKFCKIGLNLKFIINNMPEISNAAWYVVHTKPRQETRALENLQN